MNERVQAIDAAGARRRWRPLAAAVGVLSAVAAGCDPCAGVAECSVAPRLVIMGQVVTPSGRGVDGARIDVVRASGIAVSPDSLSAMTAGGGFWRVELEPSAGGEALVDVVVTTPGVTSYRVRSLPVRTSGRGGEANLQAPWLAAPVFPVVGEVYLRGAGTAIADAQVTFARTGGVALLGTAVRDGVVRSATDAYGRVRLLPSAGGLVYSPSLGTVQGSVTVQLPYGGSSTSFGFADSHLYRTTDRIVRFGVGPSLDYQLELVSRATGQALAGAAVAFHRTGGTLVADSVTTSTTLATGRFAIRARALSPGVVEGYLAITAAGVAYQPIAVRLPTFEEDGQRFFGIVYADAIPAAAPVSPDGGAD